MITRIALALVLSAPLLSAVASAAPRNPVSGSLSWAPAAPAEPACGGTKNPEGPTPPKEPPKT